MSEKIRELFSKRPKVINVGIESFYHDLKAQEAKVVAVDFRPPAGGDERLAAILRKLQG